MSKRLISIWLVLLWCASLIAPHLSQAAGPERHALGLIPASPRRYTPSLPPAFKARVKQPPAVDNSAGLPPVGDQGAQNSCVAWATTYYYKTFQEALERGWDVGLDSHQFSPAMTYNMRTNYSPDPCTVDRGMRLPDAFDILIHQGALPLSDLPYDPTDTCTQPTSSQLTAAHEYRALGYGAFFVYGEEGHVTATQVETLKSYLAQGQVFVLGIPVYSPSFFHPEENDNVVDVPGVGETFEGYHAITVVGYDDAIGGFKFVNSWGSSYADGGFAYLSYDFVQGYALEAWWMADLTASQTTVLISPTEQAISCGETTTFTVAIQNVIGMYGIQFYLTFNPDVVEVIDPDGNPANGTIIPGDIFSDGEYEVAQEVVNNTSGEIRYAITILRVPKAPPFSGSGTVAEIAVRAKAEGASPLVLADVQVANDVGEPIAVDVQDGILTVECPTTLSGHALLEGRDDHSAITVTLSGGLTTWTDAAGAYLFNDVPSGTHTITFAHDGFLTTVVTDVTVTENVANELCTYTLKAGDLNNDQVVDILDLAMCAAAFDTANPIADVNADGVVDIYDLVLIGKNFKLSGPQAGVCVP